MRYRPDTITILMRIIAMPFVFGLYVVIYAWIPIKGTYLFLRYGGEFLTYMKDDRDSIARIYEQLKKQNLK
jgi:hypothetical protein